MHRYLWLFVYRRFLKDFLLVVWFYWLCIHRRCLKYFLLVGFRKAQMGEIRRKVWFELADWAGTGGQWAKAGASPLPHFLLALHKASSTLYYSATGSALLCY